MVFFFINWVLILIRSYDIQTLNSDIAYFPVFFLHSSRVTIMCVLSFGCFLFIINYSHGIYGHCFMGLISRCFRCLLENEQSTWIETEESDIELKKTTIDIYVACLLIAFNSSNWESMGNVWIFVFQPQQTSNWAEYININRRSWYGPFSCNVQCSFKMMINH